FPLTLLVSAANELNFKIKYDSNRFDDYTVETLLIHLNILLESIAHNPDYSLIELPLLTDEEQQLLTEWNSTEAEYPQQCIHEFFAAQVERTPDATAVIFEDEKLTYQQLNIKANQLAHYLQSIEVKPEILVGICLERSLEMVIAILAVLKAGGAYVPLDPEYPQERLDFIQEETQVKTILTQEKIREILSNAAQFPKSNPVNSTALENSIYVIYTSGSTGKPKGVINTHRGLVNRLWWMQQTYQLTADDRVLQKTPFSFDVSVWEFFWTLLFGATLIVVKPRGHKDSGYLVNLIKQQQITTLHFVPSMLEAFLEEPKLKDCTSIKRVICSGEALSVELQNRFFTHLDAQLHNLYGPTEAAIDVTYYEGRRQEAEGRRDNNVFPHPSGSPLRSTEGTSAHEWSHSLTPSLPHSSYVPIGTPIHNIQIYILDSHLRQVPIGVAGELYIGGDGLARGYLKRPDLTAERFIPNTFKKGSRQKAVGSREEKSITNYQLPITNYPLPITKLYKTGDKARYLPDGNIEFLGRIDYQVKIRGFRIELGEIETVLSQHPEVKTAVVIAKEYQIQNQNNNSRLVAYVVPIQAETEATDVATDELKTSLRSFLEAKLPSYMVPSAFVILESIPLTPNGKIDRRSLLAVDEIGVKLLHQVPPRNSTEEMIATIWKEVLKIDKVGIYDNFFDLGGNSLLATRINSRLRQTFELDLPLRSIFEKPTIMAIAEYIQAIQITIEQKNPSIPTIGRKEIEL
ncbi:MAG: AMP-binding protein, partial [Cyanobacteria bacterium P01_D01_bin.116]